MGLRTQDYNELGFVNDFMFAKVMRNGKLCKQLLEVILDVTIERIDYLEEQKTINHSMDARSVRLDVYVRDDKNTVYMPRQGIPFCLSPLYLLDFRGILTEIWDTFGTNERRDIAQNSRCRLHKRILHRFLWIVYKFR